MTEAIIEVRGLTKSFGQHAVFSDIDVTVAKGDVLVLIGSSGSGKTTLLRSMNGLERPNKGIVRVGDTTAQYPGANEQDVRRLRSNSGMVFQGNQLFRNLTVLENLSVGPIRGQQRPVSEVHTEALQLLERIGLASKAHARPHQLSGGQQQRVGIARALAMRPEVLLFDEPTSALDPELVGEVLSVIRDLAGNGWTMVIATHEMRFARHVADEVIFLDGGRIVERGKPDQLLTDPQEPRTREFLARIIADV